jgi:hypothetical protein
LAIVACDRHHSSPGAPEASQLASVGYPPTTDSRAADRALSRSELLVRLQHWTPRHFTLVPARDRLIEDLEGSSDRSLASIQDAIDWLRQLDESFPDATSDNFDIGYR